MKKTDSDLLFSASDLVAFLGCRHATWRDLAVTKGAEAAAEPEDPYAELLQKKGIEHEQSYLRELITRGLSVEEITTDGSLESRVAATEAAMRRGVDVVYQAALIAAPWHGYADFLLRVDEPSDLGDWSYTVIDTKLARSMKATHAVQLSVYARLLSQKQGRPPKTVAVRLGDGHDAEIFAADCAHYVGAAMQRFHSFVVSPPEVSAAEPCAQCTYCKWQTACESEWAMADHLSGVANIRSTQIRGLRDAGINTIAGLAASQVTKVDGIAAPILERLRQQARLQLEKRQDGKDRYEVLACEAGRGFDRLPKPDSGDIFFDMEGDPLFPDGLEYLFGFVSGASSAPTFTPFWAHDRQSEKKAFEEAVDFVVARLSTNPGAHIYHYAAYEASALKRLSTLHGTREMEIDNLLRAGKLVDLYRVVSEGLRVSEPRYSLKNIETFYMEKREGDVKTAGESVIMYELWRESQDAKLLQDIQDYNEFDCVSTLRLRDWLLLIRPSEAIWFSKSVGADEDQEQRRVDAEERIIRMRDRLLSKSTAEAMVLADLLEFHRREAKPDYWAMFDRQLRPDDDLIDDPECLGGLMEAAVPQGIPEKQSLLFTYDFPAQDTKLREGDTPLLADTLESAGKIWRLDENRHRITLKRGKKKAPLPSRFSLIPNGPLDSVVLKEAIFRVAESVCADDNRYPAIAALLRKSTSRLLGGEDLASLGGDTLAAVKALETSYLLIQGPPGAGKTYTSARAIVSLLAEGKRIGVASNSHKAINNLLKEVEAVAKACKLSFRGIKKSSQESQYLLGDIIVDTTDNKDVAGNQLIAGTAWLFSRSDLDRSFDYLFVDEAGQVALANVVGMGTSAKNIVLVGDQAQLGQPTKGSHPGESGASALDYVLRDHATIPDNLGIFLPVSRRMHPDVCQYISQAFYDGRLVAASETRNRYLVLGRGAHPALRPSGISFVEAEHTGRGQRAPEEATIIRELVADLLKQKLHTKKGCERRLELDDILVVTPYNMQVAELEARLPKGAKIGTVDKFQGQEAAVVIISMTTSSAEEMPRDHEFLFSRNRLNVAISRAQSLAIVVANPRLLEVPCKTIQQIKLVNALCWARDYALMQSSATVAP